jgi:hypothetical protein
MLILTLAHFSLTATVSKIFIPLPNNEFGDFKSAYSIGSNGVDYGQTIGFSNGYLTTSGFSKKRLIFLIFRPWLA